MSRTTAVMSPPPVLYLVHSYTIRALYYLFQVTFRTHFSICLLCTGLSHQQVAVCQRHPTLQTDGGEVRIWQPVAPLTSGIKSTLEEGGGREGGRE